MKKNVILIILLIQTIYSFCQEKFILGIHRDPSLVHASVSPVDAQNNLIRLDDAYFNLLSGVNGNHLNNTSHNDERLELLNNFSNLSTLLMDVCFKGDQADVRPFYFNDFTLSTCKGDLISSFNYYTSNYNDSFCAIYLGDEPHTYHPINSENIADWIEFFNVNTSKPTFINLFPIYYSGFNNSKPSYEAYLDFYLNNDNPNRNVSIVSFDHYPFLDNNMFRSSYFYNLEIVAKKSKNKPFYAMPLIANDGTGTISSLNEEHIRFSAFCPLTYGASGLIYHFYNNAISDPNTDPNGHAPNTTYNWVKEINLYIKDFLGPIVMDNDLISTKHVSNTDLNMNFPFCSEYLLESSPYINHINNNNNMLVGIFKDKLNNYNYSGILVNKNILPQQNIEIELVGNHTNNLLLAPRIDDYSINTNLDYSHPNSIVYNSSTNITTLTIPELKGGEAIAFKTEFYKKADLSVKTDDGRWLINYSSTTFYTGWEFQSGIGAYGNETAHPVPADYDGDGKADLSIKTDDGRWLINYSSTTFYTGWEFQSGIGAYGNETAHPVPADYDGDGKADLSIKTDDGRWLINYSSTTFYTGWEFQSGIGAYGNETAHPVPGNYLKHLNYNISTRISNHNIKNKKSIISNEEQFLDFKIFPNPAKKTLHIQSKAYLNSVKVVNKLGQIIIEEKNNSEIDISTLKEGLYFLIINNKITKKFIKY